MTDEAAPAAAPKPAALPGNVTAAAVILLVGGALAGVGTVLILLAALLGGARRFPMYGDPGLMQDPMSGQWLTDGGHAWMCLLIVALLALLGAAITGAHVAAGWLILQRHRWARVLGLVVSGAALVVVVIGLLGTLVWAVAGMPPGLNDYPRRMGDYYQSMMGAMVALGTIVSLGLIAAYGFVLWVLARHGDTIDPGPQATGS